MYVYILLWLTLMVFSTVIQMQNLKIPAKLTSWNRDICLQRKYILISQVIFPLRDRSLFMEGGEGNFFLTKFLKLKAPP